MFDVSFGELALIGLVALVVLGPERLPKVARTAGHLLGRLQRYVSDVKADINREIRLEDLKKLQQQMEHSAQDMHSSLSAGMREVEARLAETSQRLAAEVKAPGEETPAPVVEPPAPEPVPTLPAEALAAAVLPAAPVQESLQLELAIDPPRKTG
ncbi:MAG: Sec-independent protein translocase protein TatB [Rhodocyclaceae bacterium]|nr:Sec-independent protein translocase protein TatB [Rhodocyclaceae bacterium]